jgi:hypothetical protein
MPRTWDAIFVCRDSGQVLDVRGSDFANHGVVQQYKFHGHVNQRSCGQLLLTRGTGTTSHRSGHHAFSKIIRLRRFGYLQNVGYRLARLAIQIS